MFVVVFLELTEFSLQIRCTPEQDPIQILAPEGSDQPFDEGMRHGHVGYRFELFDTQNSQMRRVHGSMTTMTQWLFSRIDSQRNRATLQRLSFIWPIKLSHDGPPPKEGSGRYWPANTRRTTSLPIGMPKVLVMINALLGQPNRGLRCLISTITRINAVEGPCGPGWARCRDENSRRYLRSISAWWNRSRVEGLITIAARSSRRGVTKSDSHPSKIQSAGDNAGARCRERLITSN